MSDKNDLLVRLKKVEGQVRGIQKMIEEDRCCSDLIRQVVAASRALDSIGLIITSHSIKECIIKAANGQNSDKMVDEVVKMIFNAAKSGV